MSLNNIYTFNLNEGQAKFTVQLKDLGDHCKAKFYLVAMPARD